MECPFLDELRQNGISKTEVEEKEDKDDNFIPKRITESAY